MLLELLEGTVSTCANRQALVSAKKVWTYADLSDAVEKRATELATKGVEPGRVYAIDAHAEAQTVIDFLAYWRTGASVAPLDPRLTRLEKSRAVEVLDVYRVKNAVVPEDAAPSANESDLNHGYGLVEWVYYIKDSSSVPCIGQPVTGCPSLSSSCVASAA